MAKNENFVRVDEWLPHKEDCVVKYDGKLVVIPFDKIFNKKEISVLNTFNILKDSYVRQLNSITLYINYFIKYYDEDNDLLFAYLKLKSIADNKSNERMSLPIFIQFVYNVLLTDSICDKIVDMVEDNYYVDVDNNTGKKYNEALEFTNEHAKVLMQISVAMKLMIPIMLHYINKIKYNKEKDRTKNRKRNHLFSYKAYMYKFYAGLFNIFGGDIDIYNKLWISTWSKINVHYNANKPIWDQRAIYGTTTVTHMDELLRDKIICENMFKYTFNKNAISFNHVVLRNQLGFFICEKYQTNRIELSSKKDVSGLSGLDKLEMNTIKLDESVAILSEMNIKTTIKSIEKQMRMKVSKDELQYYQKHLTITKFQVQLCQYFYARIFGGYRDLSFLTRKNYLKLLILLKKRLRLQGMMYLPDILTSNIDGRLNARTIRNDKFLSKIEQTPLYRSIVDNKYSVLDDINKGDLIIGLLSTLINTKFTIVDYDNEDKLGETIEVNQDAISDEFLNYLNQL
jgi:hypothetical protein